MKESLFEIVLLNLQLAHMRLKCLHLRVKLCICSLKASRLLEANRKLALKRDELITRQFEALAENRRRSMLVDRFSIPSSSPTWPPVTLMGRARSISVSPFPRQGSVTMRCATLLRGVRAKAMQQAFPGSRVLPEHAPCGCETARISARGWRARIGNRVLICT